MKKNITIIFLILITILILLIALLYRISYSALYADKILTQDKEIQEAFKNYEIVNCKFNLLKPEHVFISFQHYIYPEDNSEMKFWRIDFYNLKRNNIFSRNWDIQSTGGTTIRNTTFPELVKMVKEDCSQFQEVYKNPDGINWGYSKADPPKSQEEVDSDKKWEVIQINDFVSQSSKDVQSMIKERYGDTTDMSYDEIMEYARKINADDEIQRLFSPLKFEDYSEREDYIPVGKYIKHTFSKFYDNQKEEFIKFYGDPNTMTDDELYKLSKDYIQNLGFDKSLNEYFIYL